MKRIELLINQSLDSIIDILTEYNKKGEYVTCVFNGIALDSDVVDPDYIYKKCTGMTRSDFKSIVSRGFNNGRNNILVDEFTKNKYIEEGKKYIYPQKWGEWEAYVSSRIQTPNGIEIIDKELELIKIGEEYKDLRDKAREFNEVLKYDAESLEIRRNALKYAKQGDKLIVYELGHMEGEEDIYEKIVKDGLKIREGIIRSQKDKYFDLDEKRLSIINEFINGVVGYEYTRGLYIEAIKQENTRKKFPYTITIHYSVKNTSDFSSFSSRDKLILIKNYIAEFNQKYSSKFNINADIVGEGALAIVYPNRSNLMSLISSEILYDPEEYLKERTEKFNDENVECIWENVAFINNIDVLKEYVKQALIKLNDSSLKDNNVSEKIMQEVVSCIKGVYKKKETKDKTKGKTNRVK